MLIIDLLLALHKAMGAYSEAAPPHPSAENPEIMSLGEVHVTQFCILCSCYRLLLVIQSVLYLARKMSLILMSALIIFFHDKRQDNLI